jgi:lipoate---protein ligase
MEQFRLLDLPPMTAAENMALDEVLLELAGEKKTVNTIRILRFSPPTVLLGYHQTADAEIRMDYCRKNNIQVNRRITGGGAIFFDEQQLGWEIVCDKQFFNVTFFTEKLFRRLCDPVILALRRLGLDAEFRPRNDIEINGRKISGTGGTELYDAFLFQGTILVDTDVDVMLNCLNVPVEKLKSKELDSIKQRVTSLALELGHVPCAGKIKTELINGFEESFGIRLVSMALTDEEKNRFEEKLPYFRSMEWIDMVKPGIPGQKTASAAARFDAGTVRFILVPRRNGKQVKDILITGDFLSFPSRGIYDLMAELRGAPLDCSLIMETIRRYFRDGLIRIPGMSCEEFVTPLTAVFDEMAGKAGEETGTS